MNKLRWSVATLLLAFAICLILDWCFPLNLPNESERDFATVVIDANGEPLRAFADSQGVWRYQVSIDQVSPLYLEALLNYEDRHFWYHPGINPLSLLRASWQNLTSGRIVSGGSTLTMQVARILHPHRRSLVGKFQQILRTLQLEWHLSKTEILTLYLNYAPFGGTVEGVQAASYSYLAKSAVELSHAEAALLAVLPQAPTRYRPDLHPKRAEQARDKVLDRLVDFAVWDLQTVTEAKIEQVVPFRNKHPQLAPLLARRLKAQHPHKRLIHTTIDGQIQQAMAHNVARYVDRLPAGASAGALVVDNRTSQVKAYVGSAQFNHSGRFGHVDMVTATRSPGSTLKPLLFAMALDDGLIHSHSLLADVPITWGDYRPDNFSSGFSGPVSASHALQRSLNVPFVDLLERVGPQRFVDRLKNAGLDLIIPSQGEANLALILGAAGTNLEQLVTVYSALALKGKSQSLRYLADNDSAVTRYLFTPQSSWVTHHTLAQIDRAGGFRTAAITKSHQPIAWKTGTSYGYRDSWAIGVTKEYTIGVWLGRPDNTPMPGHHGRKTAGPLLFSLFNLISPQVSVPDKPSGVEQMDICWPLGTVAAAEQQGSMINNFCHQRHQAWIIDNTVPPTFHGAEKHDFSENPQAYWLDTATQLRVNAHCRLGAVQQHWRAKWPKVLEPWLNHQTRELSRLPELHPKCRGQVFDVNSSMTIEGVTQGAVLLSKQKHQLPSITLVVSGASGEVHWYLNGRYHISTEAREAWVHSFKQLGEYQLIAVDSAGNLAKVEFEVKYL